MIAVALKDDMLSATAASHAGLSQLLSSLNIPGISNVILRPKTSTKLPLIFCVGLFGYV